MEQEREVLLQLEELRKRLANPPEEDLEELIKAVENLKIKAELEMNTAKNARTYFGREYIIKKDIFKKYQDMLYELKKRGYVRFL